MDDALKLPVSILICTHNRADILPYCLESLAAQTVSQEEFEVVVIDNASTDDTQSVVAGFQSRIRNLRYVREEKIGLSQARNKGYLEAKFDWVSYVDDDAKAYPDYVARVKYIIEKYGFDCFGGRFFPWYQSSKPKWLPAEFGLYPLLLKDVGELPPGKDAAGGVIVFRKSALVEVGGFPTNLGMIGGVIGYGEENWVQNEFRKRNYKVGFDPHLKIDHLVADYKYALRWHLRRMYAKGRDTGKMERTKENSVALIFKAALFTVKESIVNLPRLATSRDYYYQNYMLDTFGHFIRVMGYISSKPK